MMYHYGIGIDYGKMRTIRTYGVNWLDQAGMAGSTAYISHCLVLLLLRATAPTVSAILNERP